MKTSLLVSWLLISLADAATVWNPAGNGITPPASGNWNTVANWTAGVPVLTAPGEIKAELNVNGAAESWITGAVEANQLVINVNGSGSVLRIKSGGSLTTGNNWSAIGYSKSNNRMVIESGGVVSFGNHLWIGFGSSAEGTLDVEGGTVNIASQLGLGWNGGVGQLNISNGGVVNASQLDGARSISGSSMINIEEGQLVINGNKSSEVHNYITAGTITGYGGTGTAIYDYNVSNPGKTTVKAIAGSIDPDWQLASAFYSTNELIITPFDALADFGIVADGVTDVTDEIQSALVVIGNIGGGALFLPAGQYKVSENLTVPSGVTLRGDWQQPVPGLPIIGTVLMAYAGRDNENAAPFISLSNSSGINGVSIWYPEQLPTDIHAYPPTIGNGGGATVENVTLVNTYFGYTTFVNGTTARPFVRNVYGTPLKVGLEFDCLADIGRIETVHFSPDYWAGSGLANAPTSGEHESWLYNNGTGMIVRRIDWSYSCYVTIEGYNIGFALRPGLHDGKVPNGQSYDFNLIDCKTGVYVEASAYAGYQFTRFDIDGAETGFYLSPAAGESTMFHSCEIDATDATLFNEGTNARVLMMSCDIQQGSLRMEQGYLSVMNSDFSNAGAHIELGSEVRGATILGNRFVGSPSIVDNTLYPVEIDHTPLAVSALPPYDYKKPATIYQPAKTNLFVVTDAPYNAVADGVFDNTAAFQAALAAADANGGGTVFVPGGTYRLNGTLTVPSGVELRGIFDMQNDTKTKGSLLNVYSGRNDANGTPFIQLEADAGIKGFTFHYPAQIYDANETTNYGMVPYPYLIRGLGADVYIMNLSATIPYQLIDLATYRCDRHYVDYVFSTALKTGIHVGNGAVDGQIQNCQFNPSAYTHAGSYYDSIPYGTSDDIHKILWRDATPYLFGHMTNEVLHENFVFGGARGFHLVDEGGEGPSGHCLGFGVDQCTVAMLIDDVGSGGLEPINSQIVTVNGTDGRYLETGPALTDAFRMFSGAGWGTHEYSAVINGGDVELQLFHVAPAAETGTFAVNNTAHLENYGGNLKNFLGSGQPFLTIEPTASAAFVANIINTTEAQMPGNTANVSSLGNLRVGALPAGVIPPITTTVWNPGSSGLWTDDANWTGGAAPISQMQNLKVVFNVGEAQECMLDTAATVAQLVMGDNGTSNGTFLALNSGANLTCGLDADGETEWSAVGYNNAADLTVANGAEVSFANHLWIGLYTPSVGTLTIDGGTVNVAGQLGLGWNTGTGHVNIKNGGALLLNTLESTRSISSASVINLEAGSMVINGNHVGSVNAYIQADRIVAYNGAGEVLVDYGVTHSGKTTVSGHSPAYGYDAWSQEWGVDIGDSINDYDSDLRNNFYEYVLNGNPTNALDLGIDPTLGTFNGSLQYIYQQRNDDTSLVYQVQTSTNLVSGVWTNTGYTVLGTNVTGGAYDEVTNRIPTLLDQTYIRLKVDQN